MTSSIIKVYELSGAALDWAVAKCEGQDYCPVTTYSGIGQEFQPTNYSTDWAQGGPIIERERISLRFWANTGKIHAYTPENGSQWYEGDTVLVAAMRVFVASKLGDSVNIPARFDL